MTKDQRLKAMNQVMHACLTIKDEKPLAEAVRKIAAELRAEEAAHKAQVIADAAGNAEKNGSRQTAKDRRFEPDVGNAIKRLSNEEFGRVENMLRTILRLLPKDD